MKRTHWNWFLLLCMSSHLAFGQQPVLEGPPSASWGATGTAPVYNGETNINEEVLQRLQQAEDKIQELQGQRPPAEGEQSSSLFEHFINVYDPEIAVAREQSYQNVAPPSDPAKPKKWYDKLSIRGYAQFRINENTHSEPGSAPAQYIGDRSIGDDQSFLIRRARVIISGDVHEHLYVYLQPDFASSVPGSNDNTFFTQVRDWYGDFYFDTDKVHRLRVGQSKVPYGWENLQSSSNRLPLDRGDALNSAVRNERDLGLFYYWTPTWAQDFFKEVLEQGLKGSGNYGVFGLGVYNGQGGSLLEQNDNLHVVSRLTLPFVLPDCQRMELGVQGYYGEYAVIGSTIDPPGGPAPGRPVGTVDFTSAATIASTSIYRDGWVDKRLAGTFVWYPQPIGLQAEWTVGRGPALNTAQTALEDQALHGGYVMLIYKLDCQGVWLPFIRYSQYEGGYKSERNAPNTSISEVEAGVEWQINPAAELTLTFLTTDRTNTTANGLTGSTSYGQFEGDVVRAQFQINY